MKSYFWPQTAVWETTLACNMQCRHCGSVAGPAREDELTTAEALNLCDQLVDIGCRQITLSGGETFLRKDWPLLVRRLREGGCDVGIISNGLAVEGNYELLSMLANLNQAFANIGIGISIDGLRETHEMIRGKPGAFQIALNAVDELQAHDLPVVVITTVNKHNLRQLRPLRDEVIFPRRIFAWQVQTSNNYGRMEELQDWFLTKAEYVELGEILAESRRLRPETPRTDPADCIGYMSKLENDLRKSTWQGCQAGLRVLGIQSNGNIKGCLSLLDDCFVEGNIREHSLLEIWDKPDGFAFNREFEPELLKGMCAGCEHGKQCRGGCTAVSHSISGTPHQAPYCIFGFEQTRHKQEDDFRDVSSAEAS